jgi:hypothetical protein
MWVVVLVSGDGLVALEPRCVMVITKEESVHGKESARPAIRSWTKEEFRNLKAHPKARTPVARISKSMRRTVGALRQKALRLGIPLGHRR